MATIETIQRETESIKKSNEELKALVAEMENTLQEHNEIFGGAFKNWRDYSEEEQIAKIKDYMKRNPSATFESAWQLLENRGF